MVYVSSSATDVFYGEPMFIEATVGIPALGKIMADAGGTLPVASVRDTAAGGTLPSNKILKSNAVPGNYNDDNLSVGNVRPVAFGISQTGDLSNLAATDAAFGALQATQNTDMAAAKVEADYAYITRGVSRIGELSTGLLVPDAIEITSAVALSSTSIRVTLAWAANAATIELYRATTSGGTYTLISTLTSGNYFDDTALTAETTYYYKARGVNATGNGAYGDVLSVTTPSAASPVPLPVVAPLSFYSVATSGDGATVDTLLYSLVAGTLDMTRISPADGAAFSEFILGYLFIPSKFLTGIGKGVKVIDSNANMLTVEVCENFDDHQEIVMRKVNS